jgi:N,N'-diacetyllegionaminate synthase
MKKILIIAEAGVNHNGSLARAKKMVAAAKAAGADAVKFQTFSTEQLVSPKAHKAAYQKKNSGQGGSQRSMLKKLELDEAAHRALLNYCKKLKIIFLSAPFDLGSIRLLDKLGLPTFKVPSGELTDLPYLRAIGHLRKKVILSTGMAGINEVRAALDVLVRAGTRKENITLLHCTTEYPAPYAEVNLRAMLTLKDRFKVKVGYSDHTPGIEVAVAAAALGAVVIEKHFTLDKGLPGPDHKASLGPAELKMLVKSIRHVETALGDGIKKPSASELKNITCARKSIVAARAIPKGEAFRASNLTVKRPGNGLSPMLWDQVLGRKAKRGFRKDELVRV